MGGKWKKFNLRVGGWETILGWMGRSAMVPYMSHNLTPLKDPGPSGMRENPFPLLSFFSQWKINLRSIKSLFFAEQSNWQGDILTYPLTSWAILSLIRSINSLSEIPCLPGLPSGLRKLSKKTSMIPESLLIQSDQISWSHWCVGD